MLRSWVRRSKGAGEQRVEFGEVGSIDWVGSMKLLSEPGFIGFE